MTTTPSTSPSGLPLPRPHQDEEAADQAEAVDTAEVADAEAPADEQRTDEARTAEAEADEAEAADAAEDTPAAWTPRPNAVKSPEEKDPEELTDEELEDLASGVAGGLSKGVLGGAAAITAAALGLASITGTWLSETIYQRQQLIGSITSSGKAGKEIIQAEYLNAWHKVAEFNGLFAVAAVVVGALVLLAGRFLALKETPNWIKAVSWGAIVLGVIGGVIALFMFNDWFLHTITVPASTSSTTG
ncbi:hypothetical protein [Streptacidiphilus monticola]|uniref:Uncharacterized protein n=1 Tax=Streptacidiphilus monticola TaxID=2161674 RepID=A0ABW1FVW1_9ACTN